MRFPPQLLDEIRARLSVSQVVGRHVQLKKRGREFVGLSPFKREKTPSFTVNDEKGFYHCFATGAHGDIFRFLMEIEGLSFFEAVEKLAGEAGVDLPKPDSREVEVYDRLDKMREAHELARQYYHNNLISQPDGEAARYLDRRHVTGEEIDRFQLGYATSQRFGLAHYLKERGFEEALLVESGLLVRPERGGEAFDRFRDRLMFPIDDIKGKTIAFGGRALLEEQKAKYLNSPETPLFHKGHILYNIHKARRPAHDKGTLYGVEGYMDVIACDSAGLGQTVAPMGTALTPEQLQALWRLVKEPVLCFDGDAAGKGAALRAIETALPHLKPNYSLQFVFLPEGQDPDDVFRREGKQALLKLMASPQPLIEVLWRWQFGTTNVKTPEQRAGLEANINALIEKIQDKSIRFHYQQALRQKMRDVWFAKPTKVWNKKNGQSRKFNAVGPQKPSPISEELKNSSAFGDGRSKFFSREIRILGPFTYFPSMAEEYLELLSEYSFSSLGLGKFRDLILSYFSLLEDGQEVDPEAFLTYLTINCESSAILKQLESWYESESKREFVLYGTEYVREKLDSAINQETRLEVLLEEEQHYLQLLRDDFSDENLKRLHEVRNEVENLNKSVGAFGVKQDKRPKY